MRIAWTERTIERFDGWWDMAATTVTSVVLALFGAGVVALALRNLFGNWDPLVRQPTPEEAQEAHVQRAVRQLHADIERYERGR